MGQWEGLAGIQVPAGAMQVSSRGDSLELVVSQETVSRSLNLLC